MNTLKLYLKPDKKRVDLLACCLYNNDDFKFIAEMVKQQTGLELTASDDLTGNLKNNADWILESHDVNVKDVYFNDYINNYNFTFNKGGSIGGFGAYNNIINPFVEPFEQAVQVAEKFDFDFLNDLDIGIGVLETIADIIPGWLESILDFFFKQCLNSSILETISRPLETKYNGSIDVSFFNIKYIGCNPQDTAFKTTELPLYNKHFDLEISADKLDFQSS